MNKTITTNSLAPVNAGFFGLGIAPKILDILEGLKFKAPTPIQLNAIPLAI